LAALAVLAETGFLPLAAAEAGVADLGFLLPKPPGVAVRKIL